MRSWLSRYWLRQWQSEPRECQCLEDVIAAVEAIRADPESGDLRDGPVFDPVRVRLIEIGEAVKALPERLLATEPALPWTQIAGMRDHLAHRYFDTSRAGVSANVGDDLPEVEIAERRLLQSVDDDS
jgi:uncharacterized protein with HEPN domain